MSMSTNTSFSFFFKATLTLKCLVCAARTQNDDMVCSVFLCDGLAACLKCTWTLRSQKHQVMHTEKNSITFKV